MRTRMKLLTVGLVLVTAAVAGCSSTTALPAGAIQDDVELAASAPASSSAGPTSSPDPVTSPAAPTEAPASPVASPTDSASGSSDDPTLLGGNNANLIQPNNNVCDAGLAYVCGGIGESGVGTVFYASSTPFKCGANMASSCNYLEVAPNGWNGALVDCNGCGGSPDKTSDWGQSGIGTGRGYKWCKYPGTLPTRPSAFGIDIGSGYANTTAMLPTVCDSGDAGNVARSYRGGGMTDWSLPSLSELNALAYYPDRNAIGGFADDSYWSSSENAADCRDAWISSECQAYVENFGGAKTQVLWGAASKHGIRAIRAF
jgi:hypothetical protein